MFAGITFSLTGYQQFAYRFGQGGYRPDEIFDSAWSVPSRYLLEVGRRMLATDPGAELLAIGNPLLPFTSAQLAAWLPDTGGKPAIIADQNNFPLVYLLPKGLWGKDERFLLLLCCSMAKMDQALLTHLLGGPITRIKINVRSIQSYPTSTRTGWFHGAGRQLMQQILSQEALKIMERRPDWRTLPFVSYQPYHAGTVLFYNLASRAMENSLFDKQILCASYADIWQALPSKQEPVWLDMPWLPRDGSMDELTYLKTALETLGKDFTRSHFIVFMRYSRIYNITPFHLADHMKFALGDSMLSPEGSIHARPPAVTGRCALPVQPLRLLMHLTGGWELKSYPKQDLLPLLRGLRALGCEITLIDKPEMAEHGFTSIKAGETGPLTEAVRNHHIFIGVDSFPHHYVRHVLGWPTIGLFANTKPCNSDARHAEDYAAVDSNLPCNPCSAERECPLFGRKDCGNFITPDLLIAKILTMAQQVYGYSA